MARRRPPRRRAPQRRPAARPRRPAARRPPVRRRQTNPLLAAGCIGGFIAICGLGAIGTDPAAGVLMLLLGTAFAFFGGKQAQRQRAQWTARAQRISAYQHMTPTEFERALATLCQRDGCRAVRVVGGAGDLGADVIATVPDGRRIVIQAKRYAPTNPVRSPEVQKVGGTYHVVHGAHLAAVVTTSRYTQDAVAYARQAGIRLFGERELAAWASRTGPAPWQ